MLKRAYKVPVATPVALAQSDGVLAANTKYNFQIGGTIEFDAKTDVFEGNPDDIDAKGNNDDEW